MSDLTGKQAAFVDEYFICEFNGTEAASRAGYKGDRHALSVTAAENLVNPRIRAAIEARLAERTMSRDEVLVRLAEQARGTMDDFLSFQAVRTTPMVATPVAEVIVALQEQMDFERAYAERAKLDDVEMRTHEQQMTALERRILRLQRRLERDPAATEDAPGPPVEHKVAEIDLVKAAERGKLHLVKSFNAKDGKIELYDKHAALVDIGKIHGLFKDVVEHKFDPKKLTEEQLRRISAGEDPAKVIADG